MDKLTIVKLKPDLIFRRYNRGILIPPSTALNETAARVFELIDGIRTLAEISDELSQEFQVSRDTCIEDVTSLVTSMEERGYVTT